MKNISSRAVAIGMILLLTTATAQTPKNAAGNSAADNKAALAKVVQLLEASGHNYTKASDNVWTIPFQGDSLKQFNVVAVYTEGLLVTFAIPVKKKNLKVTPDLLRKLLQFNVDMDRVKIAIDDEGDLVVRIDSSLRIMDGEEFKLVVEQVANATESIHSEIKAFILPG